MSNEERRFGLVVGTAFLVIGGVFYLRGQYDAAMACAVVGGLLVVAGMVIPRRLVPVYKGWMRFAHALSKITTPVFLGVVYFVVLTPIGLLRRFFSGNPLSRSNKEKTYWVKRDSQSAAKSNMERKF